MNFWQNLPFQIDPIAFSLGPINIRWYSLSYLMAFLTAYILLRLRLRRKESSLLNLQDLNDLFIWLIVGILLGGRIGYVVFYNFQYFFHHWQEIFWPFSDGVFVGLSGMSFHGGLLGAILAGILFAKKRHFKFFDLTDFIVPVIPSAYFWGRIGNFLNGELFGRPTDNFWGMRFLDQAGQWSGIMRYPSQLYEALGEGILIFILLWPLRQKKFLRRKLLGLYLMLYGIIRFFIEFTRQPDPQLGQLLLNLTMGQLLCLVMIVVGVIIIIKNSLTKTTDY